MSHKMRLPDTMGRSISISGIVVTADEDGVVDVPDMYVEQLLGHGLVDIAAEEKELQRKEVEEAAAATAAKRAASRPRIRRGV